MHRLLRLSVFACFAVCLFAQYTSVYAQVQPLTLTLDHVPIAPGDVVTVEARSFSFDLEGALVEWTVNGEIKESGIGMGTHRVTLGDVGEQVSVGARVTSINGEILGEDMLILTPASVDIVWEASGYTHPFYRGRKLPSAGTIAHAEARTQFIDTAGISIPKEDLYFEWRINERAVPQTSGKGAYLVNLPITAPFGDTALSVTVSSPLHGISASMKVRIPSTPPELTLYPADPLLGIDFAHAVNRNHVANDLESTFVLIPQFAAIRHLQDAAAHIEWYVDGNTAPSHTDDPGRITFVAEEGGVETSLAALFSVDNSSLQEVRSMWKITFDAVTESALDLFRPSVE